MRRKKLLAGFAALLILVGGLGFHFVFGYVVVQEVGTNVIVLQRKNVLAQIGANVVVFKSPDRTIVVDTQLSPLASRTLAAVRKTASAPISQTVITHWHPDHSGGVAAFANVAGVMAHENVVRILSKAHQGYGLTKPGSIHQFKPRTADGLPNEAIDTDVQLGRLPTAIDVVHYPAAHTNGDIVVISRALKVAAIGDLVWPGSFPYIDGHNGGTVIGLEAALDRLIETTTSDFRYVPGHGDVLTHDELKNYANMVGETRTWVETRLAEGKTAVEITAEGAPTDWAHWQSRLVPWSSWVQMIDESS